MRVMMAHNSSRPQITPGPRTPPYPKNIFIADLHESHKRPILESKRRISPKGDTFASLIWYVCPVTGFTLTSIRTLLKMHSNKLLCEPLFYSFCYLKGHTWT